MLGIHFQHRPFRYQLLLANRHHGLGIEQTALLHPLCQVIDGAVKSLGIVIGIEPFG